MTSEYEVAPHSGYRRYFEGPLQAEKLEREFDPNRSQFPTIQFAAGWAYAEHALRDHNLSVETRHKLLDDAEARWEQSCSNIRHVYDTFPGQFLLWPGVRWRYQLSLDTLPMMRAIIDGRPEGSDQLFQPEAVQASLGNMQKTLSILMSKHGSILERQSKFLEDPMKNSREIERTRGQEGSIIGVAVEVAAIYIAQSASNKYAVTPASLRSEERKRAGSDLLLWDIRHKGYLWDAQVKKRVDNMARRKYQDIPLLCATHHMCFDDGTVIDTLRAINEGTRQDQIKELGTQLIATVKGSMEYGCSQPRRGFLGRYSARVRSPRTSI